MQNPPPGQQQQGYGSPYGTPPNAPMTQPPGGDGGPKGKTALGGLDANLAAALGYPVGIIALIMVIMEKQNRFARFHALQSLLLIGAWIVIFILSSVVFGIIAAVLNTPAIFGLLSLLWLVWFAALIFCAYKAYQGEWFKLPVLGDMAEKFAGK